MSDAGRDDSISIGDLFAALGTGPADAASTSAKPAPKTAATRSEPAAADDHGDSDMIDVMSALGITPSVSMRTSVASTRERKERSSQREEQIREQQIRSQQWQRELEEQQRRRQMQAAREAEVEEPVVAEAPRKNGFGEDTTRIAEPSFLDRRQAPEAMAAAATRGDAQTVALGQEAPAAAAQPQAAPVAQPAATAPQPQPVPAEQQPAVAIDQPAAAAAEAPIQPDQQVTIPVEAPAPAAAEDTASTPAIKPLSESPAAVQPAPAAAAAQPEPAPAPEPQPTQVIAPISQSPAFEQPAAAPAPIQPAAAQPQPAPMPVAAPMPAPEPVPMPPAKPVDMGKKEKRGVNKGNVLGIILIVIALVCAALTVMLLTGTIDATTFSNLSNNITSTEKLESSATVFDEGSSSSASDDAATASHAVYTYVVRGTDGGTYHATETATFNTEGKLESSSIVIDVPDGTQAQGLLDQLKGEFGDSVADSGLRDGEVYLTIQIDRDDLDVDAYTELLSSNMAEFKVVDAGITE